MRRISVLAVALAAVLAPAAAHGASPHVTAEAWAIVQATLLSTPEGEPGDIETEVCDRLPPTHGDPQAKLLVRACHANARYATAIGELLDRSDTTAARRLIGATGTLVSVNRALADQLTGDCGRAFSVTRRYWHSVQSSTQRLVRAWRAGRDRDAARQAWAERLNRAGQALLRRGVALNRWMRSCKPPT